MHCFQFKCLHYQVITILHHLCYIVSSSEDGVNVEMSEEDKADLQVKLVELSWWKFIIWYNICLYLCFVEIRHILVKKLLAKLNDDMGCMFSMLNLIILLLFLRAYYRFCLLKLHPNQYSFHPNLSCDEIWIMRN